MTIALMSAAPPGSTAATEAIGHHTLVPLATYLGFHLEGLAIDDDGLVPDALDKACATSNIRDGLRAALGHQSHGNADERRPPPGDRRHRPQARHHHHREATCSARWSKTGRRPSPPSRPSGRFYVTSFTKITVPGLRIGYLAAPDRYVAAAANRHLVSNWMATPMVAEIASKWVEDGTAMELIRWQRAALRGRQAIAADVLQGVRYLSHKEALHVWLPLPGGRTEDGFVAQARLQGVGIAPGLSFRTSDAPWQPAVRISLGSTTEEELRAGLSVVAKLLLGDPEWLLLANLGWPGIRFVRRRRNCHEIILAIDMIL